MLSFLRSLFFDILWLLLFRKFCLVRMALPIFELNDLSISENENGWGPMAPPASFDTSVPFQQFNKVGFLLNLTVTTNLKCSDVS